MHVIVWVIYHFCDLQDLIGDVFYVNPTGMDQQCLVDVVTSFACENSRQIKFGGIFPIGVISTVYLHVCLISNIIVFMMIAMPSRYKNVTFMLFDVLVMIQNEQVGPIMLVCIVVWSALLSYCYRLSSICDYCY